jgi:hypothetical protein
MHEGCAEQELLHVGSGLDAPLHVLDHGLNAHLELVAGYRGS